MSNLKKGAKHYLTSQGS